MGGAEICLLKPVGKVLGVEGLDLETTRLLLSTGLTFPTTNSVFSFSVAVLTVEGLSHRSSPSPNCTDRSSRFRNCKVVGRMLRLGLGVWPESQSPKYNRAKLHFHCQHCWTPPTSCDAVLESYLCHCC